MKYLKLKEDYGESIIIGYLILAVLFPFAAVMFLGEKNFTSAILSLGCVALSVLSMLDNILVINLLTKINELNADNAWWKSKYEKECCVCAELRTKQTKLEHELDVTKCQLESSKKATQDANQQVRHLEAELSRFKASETNKP